MKMKQKKQIAAGILAGFFLVMVLCTVISRAAASLTVPLADTQNLKQGKLSMVFSGNGVVEAKEEKIISPEAGLRVAKVLQEGSQVKKGATLLEYDADYLQEEIEEKNAEIRKLELSLAQARIQGEAEISVPAAVSAGKDLDLADAELSQAQADYDQAYSEGEDLTSQAQADLDAA